MTPAELADEVLSAVRTAVSAGELPDVAPTDARIERPRIKAHGDYATGIAMQLAKAARRPPRDVAEAIAKPLRACPGVRTVEVAGPGFLNITLEAAAKGELARTVVSAGDTYGRTTTLAGQRINLEFVSANPTGPLHLGHTRWAAVGEALARSLQAAGAEVTKEYYFNDHGAQIDRFARSLLSRARRVDVPDDGYAGAYIDEIAGRIVAEEPGVLDLPDPDAQEIFRKHGVELMFSDIKQSLHEFGTDFDVFFHEDSLHESGAVERAVARLRELGHVYEHEGAVWLRTSEFGDDKDRVVIKSDGHPAYIAADLAYYLDKRERGFDRVIIMLGPDHHGYIGRLMAMCACFGDVPGENLEILIGQMVNMVRRGEPIRMSKRAGTVVTLEDLVDAIGVDAARYALIRSSVDANIDIDLDVWTKNTNDNPVFYVQYGHARISGVLRNARELGIEIGNVSDFRPELLEHEREGELLRALGEFPQVVATAAELREPHRVPRYLEELAGTFHRFYDSCRVLPRGDEETTELHRARLWLVEATRVVLKNGAQLVGITAPERM